MFCNTWHFMADTVALVDPGLSHGGLTEKLRMKRGRKGDWKGEPTAVEAAKLE